MAIENMAALLPHLQEAGSDSDLDLLQSRKAWKFVTIAIILL